MSIVFDYQNLEVKSRSLFAGHTNSVDAVRCHPTDAATFASGSHDSTIAIWNLEKAHWVTQIQAQTEGIWSLDWSHDGRLLLSTGPAGKVYVTDAITGKTEWTCQAGIQKGYAAHFLDGNRTFVVAGQNGNIEKWEVGGSAPKATFSAVDRIVYAWEKVPSSDLFLAATSTGEFLLLNQDLGLVKSFGLTKHEIRCFTFFGGDLAAGYQNGDLKVLHFNEKTQELSLSQEVKGHRADISAMLWAPKLDLLVTGAKDSSVFAWRGSSKKSLHNLVGHKDQIADLSLNSTGTTLVTASWDQTLRAYSVKDFVS